MKKTIGIIGCGAIGSALAEYADKNLSLEIDKIILCDIDTSKAKELKEKLKFVSISEKIENVIKEADLIIEAVSPVIAPEVMKLAIKEGKDVMIMSIGGLLGNEELLSEARDKGTKVLLPSGAIAGIDAVKAAKNSEIESVTLTTHKAPKSIKGAPYFENNKIDLDNIKEETVIFEGNALQAVKGFPKNVNVSALLSLAGVGPEKTKVIIKVSPEYTRNIHQIEVKSSAGNFTMRTENVPSPSNPKTSYLAALAAIASLKGYFDSVRIGT